MLLLLYFCLRPVFYLYAILKSISAVLMLFINLEFKSPATSVVADVMSLMNIELISLFVACFLLGKYILLLFILLYYFVL